MKAFFTFAGSFHKLSDFYYPTFLQKALIKTEHMISLLFSLHVALLLLFFYSRTYLMVFVNLCSLLIYACCYFKKASCSYPHMIFISFTEMLIHMILATLSIGWNSGFYLYILAMIPTIYYLSYVIANIFEQKIAACRYSFVLVTAFIVLRLLSYIRMPIYQTAPLTLVRWLYFVNACITASLFVMFMSLFSSAISKTEDALKAQNRKLNALASIDPLTGFYNRRSMNEFLTKAMLHASRANSEFCVVLGDIDNFKQINDAYGHECGDLVLKKIAQIMQNDVCSKDYICRWGGEEVLILLHDCNYEDAIVLAEKIRADIAAASLFYNKESIQFSMTFGIHKCETDYNPSNIIKNADKKLYQGKRNGKNCVVS